MKLQATHLSTLLLRLAFCFILKNQNEAMNRENICPRCKQLRRSVLKGDGIGDTEFFCQCTSEGDLSLTSNVETFKKVPFPPCAGDTQQNIYRMTTKPRGVAFIINNVNFESFDERFGSDKDKENLCVMFKRLGWLVTSKRNLTAKQMDVYLQRFSTNDILKSASALAVVVLSHGLSDLFFGTDGKINKNDKSPSPGTFINDFQLKQHFTSSSCEAMKGKPKWFILQSCRGCSEDIVSTPNQFPQSKQLSSDHPSYNDLQNVSETKRFPETADMCFLFSSSKGFKSYRWREKGSPFINTLRQTVEDLAHSTEFYNIIKKILQKFCDKEFPEGIMTLPDYSTQLTCDWYLNPPVRNPIL